jgi:hypothetical protein
MDNQEFDSQVLDKRVYVLEESGGGYCGFVQGEMENLADLVLTILLEDRGDADSIDLVSLLSFKKYLKRSGENDFSWSADDELNPVDSIRRKVSQHNWDMIISEHDDSESGVFVQFAHLETIDPLDQLFLDTQRSVKIVPRVLVDKIDITYGSRPNNADFAPIQTLMDKGARVTEPVHFKFIIDVSMFIPTADQITQALKQKYINTGFTVIQ